MIHASDKYSIYIKILIYIRYISKISDIFKNITIFSIPGLNLKIYYNSTEKEMAATWPDIQKEWVTGRRSRC